VSESFGSFLDQDPELSAKPLRLLADTDISQPWEVDEHGIFLLANGKYAYIGISGCSCWPDRGGTDVEEADSLEELHDKVAAGNGEWSYGLGLVAWRSLVEEAKSAPPTPVV